MSSKKRKRDTKDLQLSKKARIENEGGGVWEDADHISRGVVASDLLGRRWQTQLLMQLLSRSFLPPCVYVSGPRSSGKTVTISTVISALKLKCAMVCCRESYCPELLFADILTQLSDSDTSSLLEEPCSSLHTFVSLFKQLPCLRDDSSVCIVLDNADWLIKNTVLLSALKRLPEIISSPRLCVMIVSNVVMCKFFHNIDSVDVIPLHFPQYSKDEILDIMMLDCPDNQPHHFFRTFVHHIWNVFHIFCRDLYELRQLSTTLFPKYIEPVEKGEVPQKEARQLWKCMEPHFRNAHETVLRDVSFKGAITAPSPSTACELSVVSKYLLIAAFLASYNPSRTDKRIFSKLKQSKHRKSHRKSQATTEQGGQQQLGPKEFSLDRLMAIYCSIVSEPVPPAAHLHAQVSMLVSVQYLSQCSKAEALDTPKYKCLINLPLAQQVSRTVGFDLIHHLHDFNV